MKETESGYVLVGNYFHLWDIILKRGWYAALMNSWFIRASANKQLIYMSLNKGFFSIQSWDFHPSGNSIPITAALPILLNMVFATSLCLMTLQELWFLNKWLEFKLYCNLGFPLDESIVPLAFGVERNLCRGLLKVLISGVGDASIKVVTLFVQSKLSSESIAAWPASSLHYPIINSMHELIPLLFVNGMCGMDILSALLITRQCLQ